MAFKWVSQPCWRIRTSTTVQESSKAATGLLFILLVQLLVVPLQLLLDRHGVNLPASILVMVVLASLMLVANRCDSRVELVFSQYIKGPTDFIGRHMSFGFVAWFVMLSRDHIDAAGDVPRVAGAFVVTSLLSYIASYLYALGSFAVESRLRGLRPKANRLECDENVQYIRPDPMCSVHHPERTSETPEPGAHQDSDRSPSPSEKGALAPPTDSPFFCPPPPQLIAFCLLVTVGIPVSAATGYDMPLEASLFTFFWISTVHFQRSLKTWHHLESRSRLKTTLIILFNPVLLCSALCTAYLWAKTAVGGHSISQVLDAFRRHPSWASILVAMETNPSFSDNIGAGDLAVALLDAGIVSLAFKMFEYRRELWNSFATVLTTSSIMAVANLFLNVLIAHAIGLAPEEALSFAARNVTIALGVPAVRNLGGSETLMSALVVFSGMLFQMTGDLLFSWLGIEDRPPPNTRKVHSTHSGDTESGLSGTSRAGEVETRSQTHTIAAGVTVGINAAAMGTAHLIERNSESTAYAALSMTLFGAVTVALTALPDLVQCLQGIASR